MLQKQPGEQAPRPDLVGLILDGFLEARFSRVDILVCQLSQSPQKPRLAVFRIEFQDVIGSGTGEVVFLQPHRALRQGQQRRHVIRFFHQ